MSQPRPPSTALILARGAVDDRPQIEDQQIPFENILEHGQHSEFTLNGITRSLYLFPARYLPTIMKQPPRFEAPLLPYAISARYRSNGAQDGESCIRSRHVSQKDERNSILKERNERDHQGGEDHKAKPKKTVPSTLDIRRIEHKHRVAELKEKVRHMLPESGSAVVLMCWGKPSCCSILPVRVSSPENEVSTWSDIQRAWYNRRGSWRKFMPGWMVAQVDSVDLSILGLKDTHLNAGKCEYVGAFSEIDKTLEKRRLEKIIGDCDDTSGCFYNRYTDSADCTTDHSCMCYECYPGVDDAGECPAKILNDARRKLSLLTNPVTMRNVFSSPALASSNDFLKNERLVYSHREILDCINPWYISHRPSLIEPHFKGIFIDEGWTLDRRLVFLLLAAICLMVVLAAQFVFGWDTAWTVGSFFVAVLSLWMLASSMVD